MSYPLNQRKMKEDKVIKNALVFSFCLHIGLIGGLGIYQPAAPKIEIPKEEKIKLRLEIKKQALLPYIKKIEDVKKIVEQKKQEPSPEPQQQAVKVKEAISVESAPKPEPEKISAVKIPQKKQEEVKSQIKEEEAIFRYQDSIKRKIEENRRYPYIARMGGMEGVACIEFTVYSSGKLGNASFTSKCRHNILNEEAMNTIFRAQPFEKFPSGILRDFIKINASVVFDLQE